MGNVFLLRLAHAGVATLLATSTLATTCAFAAPPDVTRYCQTHVHPGVPTSYSTQDGRTPVSCVGRDGEVLVDFAVACKLTTGSEAFRYIDGFKIDCGQGRPEIVAKGPGVYILQPADLAKYCTRWAGPGAKWEYSAALKRLVCAGGSIQGPSPHTINLAIACQTAYRTSKVRYVDGGSRYHVACLS